MDHGIIGYHPIMDHGIVGYHPIMDHGIVGYLPIMDHGIIGYHSRMDHGIAGYRYGYGGSSHVPHPRMIPQITEALTRDCIVERIRHSFPECHAVNPK